MGRVADGAGDCRSARRGIECDGNAGPPAAQAARTSAAEPRIFLLQVDPALRSLRSCYSQSCAAGPAWAGEETGAYSSLRALLTVAWTKRSHVGRLRHSLSSIFFA